MSDYEHRVWQELLADAEKQRHRAHRIEGWTRAVTDRAKQVARGARDAAERLPGVGAAVDTVDASITAAMQGLHVVLVERGLTSVSPAGVFAMFADDGVAVDSYAEVQRLDLRHCDESLPRRKDRYLALAAGTGAASSLAVTGAVVSSPVTGGTSLAVAASAIAADVSATLVGMGRIVALVAAHYGYDARDPQEQVFASGVLAYSSAGNSSEEAAALASLSRLTAQMMRRTTWRQLQRHQMVTVIRQMLTSLGSTLTKRKMAQTVPAVGAVINGGLNARIAHKTFERSQRVYRLRFLTEKHHLDPADWAPAVTGTEPVGVPLVDEVVEAERSDPG